MKVKIKTFVTYIFYIIIISSPVTFSSCAIFIPLPLEPIANADSTQVLSKSSLSKFNGDYKIFHEGSKACSLDYAFTYARKADSSNQSAKGDYIKLSALDDKRIRATLFINDKAFKNRTIKGKVVDDYFVFHSGILRFKWIFFVYEKQSNRIALSRSGDLYLDTNKGGIGFLLILPIPLSGSSTGYYNLKFKRKDNSR